MVTALHLGVGEAKYSVLVLERRSGVRTGVNGDKVDKVRVQQCLIPWEAEHHHSEIQERRPAGKGSLPTERNMSGRGSSNGAETRDTLPTRDVPATPPASTDPSAGPIRRVVRITNPLGLHHRAADRFSRAARRFACRVTIHNGDLAADGKNIWDLLGLVVLPDQEVILETEGPDAHHALEELATILGAPNGEDYTI